MLKYISDLLHRMPWWGLIGFGLGTLFLLVLVAIPLNVMRIEDRSGTPTEARAIQREIDAAFGVNALGLAESVVKTIQGMANDPVRRAELDRALDEIARAREDVISGTNIRNRTRTETKTTIDGVVVEHHINVREDPISAAQEAIDQLEMKFDAAHDVAIAEYEVAVDARQAVEQARDDMERALKQGDIPVAEWPKTLENRLAAVHSAEVAAKKNVEAAREALRKARIHAAEIMRDAEAKARALEAAERTSHAERLSQLKLPSAPTAPLPPKPDATVATPAAPTASTPPLAPVAPAKPTKEAKQITPVTPVAPAPPAAPAPAAKPTSDLTDTNILPETIREEIRKAVASDFFRLVSAIIILLLFIPLFMVALIAKFFIGRSRALQNLAEQKGSEAERHNIRRQLTEARLQALQAQVEPHFLYNTLANVQALIDSDPPAANLMVGHLIDYLRAALPKMRESVSTVAQEVELARAYLNILKMRMGDRMEFSINVAEGSGTSALPPLMLPSLVENAIKHGLEPLREGGRIDIAACIEGDRLLVTVTDNGRGMTDAKSTFGGVGLTNIRERLIALYGDKANLVVEENTPRGVIARISVPLSAPRVLPVNGDDGTRTSAIASDPIGEVEPSRSQSTPARFLAATGRFLGTAHSHWQRLMIATYSFLMLGIGIAFIVVWIGQMFDVFPLTIATDALNLQFTGISGIVLSALLLLAAYGILSLVLMLVFLLLYGVGILVTGILLVVPVFAAISIITPLVPFLLIGFVFYWLLKRKNG
jgi:Histidine kinase